MTSRLPQLPQLLYQFAAPYNENQWLIVPTRFENGRHGFYAFASDGEACGDELPQFTYLTPEAAIEAGRGYVDAFIEDMLQDELGARKTS